MSDATAIAGLFLVLSIAGLVAGVIAIIRAEFLDEGADHENE